MIIGIELGNPYYVKVSIYLSASHIAVKFNAICIAKFSGQVWLCLQVRVLFQSYCVEEKL